MSLSVKQWLRETNLMAATTLFILSILAGIFSASIDHPVHLRVVENATSTRTASTLNVGAVFIVAVLFQMIGHVVSANKSTKLELNILKNKKFDIRTLSLLVSFPLLHAAVLVGVAQVVDSWAVFASFLMTFLILALIIMFNKRTREFKAFLYCSTVIILIFYVAFWILAWVSGKHTRQRAFQLGGFNCGTLLMLVIYFLIMRNTSTRINALSNKKVDGESADELCVALVLYQEAMFVCISVGFAVISVTTWIGYASSRRPGRNVAIAVSVSLSLHLLMSYAITHRLNLVKFDKEQINLVQSYLFGQNLDDQNDKVCTVATLNETQIAC